MDLLPICLDRPYYSRHSRGVGKRAFSSRVPRHPVASPALGVVDRPEPFVVDCDDRDFPSAVADAVKPPGDHKVNTDPRRRRFGRRASSIRPCTAQSAVPTTSPRPASRSARATNRSSRPLISLITSKLLWGAERGPVRRNGVWGGTGSGAEWGLGRNGVWGRNGVRGGGTGGGTGSGAKSTIVVSPFQPAGRFRPSAPWPPPGGTRPTSPARPTAATGPVQAPGSGTSSGTGSDGSVI
jgi:hypothetical protein